MAGAQADAEDRRPPAPRYAAPSSYTPSHLADRILKDRTALQGERKHVTVLFADVSGFTRLSERLDPEEVHALMNQAFERMLAEIHRYEGTVNQFLGDGLMALFGAPVAHEDHARRAALAARGLQRALAEYRRELASRGLDFQVRMGLNTGPVVVGAIGDNLRMDYTAVGDTTNVAARMQQMAEPGQIVVAEATRRLIEGYFTLRSLGMATLKNRTEPVAAWELGPPTDAPGERPLSPLLGRAEALATLERTLAAARAGRGQAVYVVGEPGMGKSRLLLELHRRAGDTAEWIEGHCLSFGRSTAFLPFIEALRHMFGIADTDAGAQIIDKIGRGLEPYGEDARDLAPYVRFALSVDPGDPAVLAMDATARRDRLLGGISRLVRLRSMAWPTVMVIEDLHWIDGPSEEYLKSVIDSLAGTAVLLILTEELYADRLEERAEELAHHFGRGEVWDKAARHGRHAGDRAAALCVDARAVEFYERALEALGRAPDSPETGRLGIDIRLAMRAPLWRAGQLDRLMEILKEAEAVATRHGETDRLDAVYSFFVQYYWAKGEQDQAIAYGERCLETAERRRDLALAVTGHYYLGWAYRSLGECARALEHFRRIIDLLEGPQETERFGLSGLPYSGACALGAECLAELGDEAGALALVARGERVANAADHLYSKVPLAVARGQVLVQRGSLAEALAVLEPAAAVCREKKFAGQLMLVLQWLGLGYALAGRPAEGVPRLEEAIALQEQAGAYVNRASMIGKLAEIYLHAGCLDEAEATARRGIEFARRHHEQGYEARLEWTLGEAVSRRGDQAAGVRHFGAARALAESLGMRRLAERCRESVADLEGRGAGRG
ncbi:MAG: adenylate/guanylate cyclase domain-containing protein [Candidatus Rokuibacteriota bacterium]